jgi:hypothetical protein
MADGTASWADEYRTIIDFYYWEPQHLGRIKNPLSPIRSWAAAWDRVSKLEVATNHILNLYFALVPLQLINLGEQWCPRGNYEFVSSERLEDMIRQLHGATQPDMIFHGTHADAAIELKIASRSSLSQVHKYVQFHLATRPLRPLTLIYLTPYTTVADVFEGQIEDAAELHQRLLASDTAATVDGFAAAVQNLDVRYRTYQDLADAVIALTQRATSVIERRVHGGLLAWLSQRRLADVQLPTP